ncbi:T9SS type A sorting domain-containing protein [Cryomorpha ignava]|uniref:T9SS type A sorting domain-containing protein n=1 Tax=Cryomorpha ignava TaxID=101383 RepID=A0A7K3WQ74_9FLAO|nr:T9SS type A sorting domain-containing protein [Cryomorpha ignava]NEN23638.1 T9SS type A sorting domain-containing protein [Cryomorpha ignava]
MKRTLQSLTVVLGLMTLSSAHAQVRYLDQIFETNQLQSNVGIGFNIDALRSNLDSVTFASDYDDILAIMANGETPPLNYFQSNGALPVDQQTTAKLYPIRLDIYTPPASDTEVNRPVIIYLHTGNFLPPVINGSPTGTKIDSAAVNLCKQWARSGYVVASVDYRMGWNPLSTVPDIRRGTLLQAVYRALHDAQTSVRYMRATVAQGNPYNIDPTKIALFGQGSGGYVSQAYATLDDYNTDIAIQKFIGEDGFPYVIESIDGTIDGGPGSQRLPDPLQLAGISKEISLSMNIGGALADISWLDDTDPPMISLHCVRDPFAPFDDGTVVVPTTNEDVVDVSGANVFIQEAVDLGNNAAFLTIPNGNDPYTDRARSLYGQTFDYILPTQPTITVAENPEGLFPFVLPINTINGNRFTNQGGPWDWWDFGTLELLVAGAEAATGNDYDAALINAQSVAGNPGMGPEKGLAYIDTIQGYINPRMMCVFELEGAPCITGISKVETQNNTTIFPNPSQSAITIRNTDEVIRRIQMIDITGRVVLERNVNDHTYLLERGQLSDGVYLLQITFDNQQITKKVLFN